MDRFTDFTLFLAFTVLSVFWLAIGAGIAFDHAFLGRPAQILASLALGGLLFWKALDFMEASSSGERT